MLGARFLIAVLGVLLLPAAALAGFDWGTDCSSGDGSFDQQLSQGAVVTVGEIPVGKRGVEVRLDSDTDVDIQLIDAATGHQIVAWPSGDLNGASEACAAYLGRGYCYSGYNGDQTSAGLGKEWIRVNGDTDRRLIMKAYGYQSGTARVLYRWVASPSCNEVGSGAFAQWVGASNSVRVGEIPSGKVNVKIELEARYGRDVDIQLLDARDGRELVAWPNGDLNGPTRQEISYQGMTLIYSGYNGVDGNWGHETIEIQGQVTRPLLMKAYGYQSGFADVRYQWGIGAGKMCGGIGMIRCPEGLSCKGWQRGVSDPAGNCHTENWCLDNASAAADCDGLMHIMVPGRWSCSETFECAWQTGQFCSNDDPSYNYVGNSPEQCATMRYTCMPFQSHFSDDCGCGCLCPETLDCEPGPGGQSCDLAAIRNACPDTFIAL